MKAAVIFQQGEAPRYTDFPEPVIQHENEMIMYVKAAAIKHLDRMRASGRHYSVEAAGSQPKIIGGDGIGLLEDGTRVYAVGATGMIAERVVIEKNRMVKLPDGIDDATAAALPNAVMGSAMALRFRASMQPGATVLINGATGVTGKVAVQGAKYYGAEKIIVTGRNEQSLQSLLALGADEIITLQQDDENLVLQIKAIHDSTPIDIVIDYLWGHSAELILSALKGNGSFSYRTRYVTIGGMTGDKIELSSSVLRSTDLQINGSGLGSWTKDEVQILLTEILPEMFQLAAANKLKIATKTIPLTDIEKAWDMDLTGGERLVVTI